MRSSLGARGSMAEAVWTSRTLALAAGASLALALLLAARLPGDSSDAPERAAASIDFDRDIRPVLSDKCFTCHGPDAEARKARLRLDIEEDAKAALRSGGHAIVAGAPEDSELIYRVATDDPFDRMPPEETGKVVSAEEVQLLRRWIAEGAPWAEHWAFVSPQRPTVPVFRAEELPGAGQGWGENPIDAFVLRRMREQGLQPSAQADRASWLRRVSFDLTGLPPSVAELEDFLADQSPSAYEDVVARLLASPRYGERMAADWLDAARYADTHGYHYDNEREMWPWRDWVIQAYAANMAYDRFVIEQLAGDLLPEATQAQRIATGFNRNHPINWEGGIVAEEYLAEYVVDRVATTSTVFLGLTVGCARCHDHKFDPISQREFYELYDFFHQVPENGIDGQQGNAAPTLAVITEEQQAQRERIERDIAQQDARLAEWAVDPQAFERWRSQTRERNAERWHVLVPIAATAENGAELTAQEDGSLFATGPHAAKEAYTVTATSDLRGANLLRLEAMADERLPEGGPGRAFHANIVLSDVTLEVAPAAGEPREAAWEPVELAYAHADHSQPGFHVARAIDGDPMTGWALNGAPYGEDRTAVFVAARPMEFEGEVRVRVRLGFESEYAQHALGRFRISLAREPDLDWTPSTFGPWSATLDGAPVEEIVLGDPSTPERVKTLAERGTHVLTRAVEVPSRRAIHLALGTSGHHTLRIDGEVVHQRHKAREAKERQDEVGVVLEAGRHELTLELRHPDGPGAFALERLRDEGPHVALRAAWLLTQDLDAVLDQARRALHREALRAAYLAETDPRWSQTHAARAGLQNELALLLEDVPTTMVMGQLDERRTTHVLGRGRYDAPGDEVTASVPAVLSPALSAQQGKVPDRLDLARWLVDPEHPLTARVVVNRLWAQCFGRGLVATTDDFGTQGARPSHPELLDWLAVELIESGWDVQRLLRLMVTSRTYRQSSRVETTARERDPDNVWLARSSRLRLSAEAVRDAALLWGGLLVETVGGPPVKPYQPPGLWEEVGSDFDAFSANRYVQDVGPSLYRRSLYTFRKRSVPPPGMLVFDAPTREVCAVGRPRTNTPLQALALMNDVTYVEAARGLAERVLLAIESGPEADGERLEHAWRTVLSRPPSDGERERMLEFVRDERTRMLKQPERAEALLSVGESERSGELNAIDHAVWTLVASLLLNLDETITRG